MKNILKIGIPIVIVVISVTMLVPKAKANRSYFVPTVQTASATTSPDYMPAVGASLTLDAYTYSPTSLNSATLFVQSTASTSAAVQTLTITYSQDGIDWYQNNLSTTTSASVVALDNTQRTYTITGNATASTTRLAIDVPTPTRYVKVSVATSTANSSIWMQWIPKREMTE